MTLILRKKVQVMMIQSIVSCCENSGWPNRKNKCIFWILLLTLSVVYADLQGYRTAYGCEGESLSISCESDYLINVIRANFGRFSITICNNHGNTEWSVKCHSLNSLKVLTETCTGKSSCTLEASTSIFDDGCPGTRKYLETHYQCVSGSSTTTTGRPLPPWVVNTKMPAWFPPSLLDQHNFIPYSRTSSSTVSSTIQHKPPITEKSSKARLSFPATTPSYSFQSNLENSSSRAQSIPVTTPSFYHSNVNLMVTKARAIEPYDDHKPLMTTNSSYGNSQVTTPTKETNYDETWCPPTFTRGLMWNWTENANLSELPCPGGATGYATRKCNSGHWSEPPDLSDCRSAWLKALEKRGRSNIQDSTLAVAIDLAKVTASKALYGGDVITAARLIKHLSSRMMKDVSSVFLEPHQKQALVKEFLVSALSTVSSLLKAGMMGPWGDLSGKERREAVTAIMVGLEEATFLLANSLSEDSESVLEQSHILASARSIRADGSQVRFPSLLDQTVDWTFPDSVLLPPEVIFGNSGRTTTRVVFLTYKHMEDLLVPTNNSVSSRSGGRKATYVVNSRVVSASLGHGRHIQISELSKPVLLTFSLLRHENVSNPICAFWDYTTHDWSDEGCLVLSFNRSHVTCKCDHLTNFAILMEESTSLIGSSSEVELYSPIHILTFVGCLICLVFITGAILLFTLFKGLCSKRTHVHRHVCLCLFVAELTFLIGIWRTEIPVLCGVVAGILLYSVLTTFSWMLAEGVYIYFTVTRLLEVECVTLRWWHYVVTYGWPTLVVASAAIADPFSFGTTHHCWLQTENYFILALVVPVLVLLAMQLVLLGASVLHTYKFTSEGTLKTKEISIVISNRSWMRCTTLITLLTVLTWVLGLLLIHRPTVVIAAVFCTFNGLLGVCIFIYYFFINQKFVPILCNATENTPSSISHFSGAGGGTYMVGSIEGSCTPPNSVITHAAHSSLSGAAPLTENTSYKSFSRDSGHGGSELEDSPRTPWNCQQRYDLRTQTLGNATLMAASGVIPNSCSFSPLSHNASSPSAIIMVDRRIRCSNHHPQTYIETDPVYEEINSRGETIQVSDLSDEDNNKRHLLKDDSPRSCGGAQYSPLALSPMNHRGRCEYQLPLGAEYRYQSFIGPGCQSPIRAGCQSPIGAGYQSSMRTGCQSPMRSGYQSPVGVEYHQSPVGLEYHQSPVGVEYHQSPVHLEYQSPVGMEGRHLLSEEILHQTLNKKQNLSANLARHYLSSENLMTVAVLNGEQVVCRLSNQSQSPAGGVGTATSPNPRQLGQVTPSSSDSATKHFKSAI